MIHSFDYYSSSSSSCLFEAFLLRTAYASRGGVADELLSPERLLSLSSYVGFSPATPACSILTSHFVHHDGKPVSGYIVLPRPLVGHAFALRYHPVLSTDPEASKPPSG